MSWSNTYCNNIITYNNKTFINCSHCLTMQGCFFRFVILKWIEFQIGGNVCSNYLSRKLFFLPWIHWARGVDGKRRLYSIQIWIVYCINKCREHQKMYEKRKCIEKTQEWNLIKWNCVTCCFNYIFIAIDRDFNGDSLFFTLWLLLLSFFIVLYTFLLLHSNNVKMLFYFSLNCYMTLCICTMRRIYHIDFYFSGVLLYETSVPTALNWKKHR